MYVCLLFVFEEGERIKEATYSHFFIFFFLLYVEILDVVAFFLLIQIRINFIYIS